MGYFLFKKALKVTVLTTSISLVGLIAYSFLSGNSIIINGRNQEVEEGCIPLSYINLHVENKDKRDSLPESYININGIEYRLLYNNDKTELILLK